MIAEYKERIVRIPHYTSQFRFQNAVQKIHNFLFVDVIHFVLLKGRHRVLQNGAVEWAHTDR
jgi:hypothetical protein